MPSTMTYSFKVVSPAVEFTSSFNSSKFVSIHCNSGPDGSQQTTGLNFIGNLQTLRIQGTADYFDINPNEFEGIVVAGYRDEAGTELILEPTAAQIYPDITGGKHSANFSLDLIINLAPTDVLYLFIKTIHIKADGTTASGLLSTYSVEELEVVCRRN